MTMTKQELLDHLLADHDSHAPRGLRETRASLDHAHAGLHSVVLHRPGYVAHEHDPKSGRAISLRQTTLFEDTH